MKIALFRSKKSAPKHGQRYWDNQDIADFYRAVDILKRAGLDIEVDSGVTDEGEPWFVFVRSEDGEVLAHFAQIDGRFVAVSSMKHEVYKGSCIREIVDKMLDRNPLVLPKQTGRATFSLHPTAAITAFLAAAFVLNIDGIKLSNVKEILVTLASKDPSAVTEAAVLLQNSSKGELNKWGWGDTTSMSFNFVVLGAALIAHEFTLTDSDGEDPDQVGLRTLDFDLGNDILARDNELGFLVKSLADFSLKATYIAQQEAEKIGLKQYLQGEEDEGENKGSASDSNKDARSELSAVAFPDRGPDGMSASNLINALQAEVSESKVEYRNNDQLVHVREVAHHEPELTLLTISQHDSSKDDMLIAGTETVGGILENKGFGEDVGAKVGVAPVELSVDGTDGIGLVSVQKVELGNDVLIFDQFSKDLASLSTVGFVTGEQYEGSVGSLISSEDAVVESPVLTPALQLPITGHSTRNSSNLIDMTPGIDVVFYEGGDVEIEGFELGVDLLWFFLPADQVSNGEKSINDDGDLLLDFGENGTLVFLGLVPNFTDELFV